MYYLWIKSSSSSGSFEFSSFRSDVWFCMRSLGSWGRSEMSEGFSLFLSSEKEASWSGWISLSELVEGQDFSAVGKNSLPGFFCELECADLEFGDFQKSDIIGDIGDNHKNVFCDVFVVLWNGPLGELGEWAQGDWVPVDSGLLKSL